MASWCDRAAPNESFWLSAIDTQNLETFLQGSLDADVVCVGGGYTSLVTAYCLKKAAPEKVVVVLESRYVGFGASGRNAGMVLHELHANRVRTHGANAVRFTYDRTVEIVDFIETLSREEGIDCNLERTGYLQVGFYPAHWRRLEEEQRRARALGVELPLWSQDQVQAGIHSRRFTSALLFPRAALIHPGKYLAGLKRACLRLGVRIFEQSPVTEIRPGVEVTVTTPLGTVRARTAVLGLNAYLPSTRLRVVRNRAVSLKSFIVLTAPLSSSQWREIGWVGGQGYSDARRVHNYVRPVGDRILFGGRVLYDFGVGSAREEDKVFSKLHRELVNTFPSLADVPLTHRWSGPVALTWKRTPLVGGSGNIFYSFGYSGMGVSLGTLCGRVLADLVQGAEASWKNLLYLDDRMWPLPPEPLRFLGFKASYYAMRLLDAVDGRL